MKLRTLTVATAGVLALSLAACQKKEEAPAADAAATPAADAAATAPADPMATTPPADPMATTPPADATATPPAADAGAMSATPAPTEPEKK